MGGRALAEELNAAVLSYLETPEAGCSGEGVTCLPRCRVWCRGLQQVPVVTVRRKGLRPKPRSECSPVFQPHLPHRTGSSGVHTHTPGSAPGAAQSHSLPFQRCPRGRFLLFCRRSRKNHPRNEDVAVGGDGSPPPFLLRTHSSLSPFPFKMSQKGNAGSLDTRGLQANRGRRAIQSPLPCQLV